MLCKAPDEGVCARAPTRALSERMRAFTATFGAETNTFSPIPTGWAGFETAMLWRPGSHPEAATEATGPLVACREMAAEGWSVREGTCAFAWPGGVIRRDVYESLRDEILDQIRAAGPLDLIALGLHGAMMAQGYDDCEGDFLERVRDVAGPAKVGAVFDLHAHLSPRMVAAADMLIGFKHYPHTDFLDRSRELVRALAAAARRETHPMSVLRDCHMLIGFRTTVAPWRGVVRQLEQIERRPGVLSVSIAQGFALGDNPDMGTKILVVTDSNPTLAAECAEEVAQRLRELRHRAIPQKDSVSDKLESARRSKKRPVIIADTSDNPGGGAAGDDTRLLRAMLDRGMQDICAGPLWDPQAVQFCFEAGVGAALPLRVGGKCGPESGAPLDLDGCVIGLARGATQRIGDFRAPLGDVAAYKAGGLTLLLSSLRDQGYDPGVFTQLGIPLQHSRFIVVKSSQQFRLGFERLGGRILSIAQPAQRIYRKRPRPLWPFEDSTPVAAQGSPR